MFCERCTVHVEIVFKSLSQFCYCQKHDCIAHWIAYSDTVLRKWRFDSGRDIVPGMHKLRCFFFVCSLKQRRQVCGNKIFDWNWNEFELRLGINPTRIQIYTHTQSNWREQNLNWLCRIGWCTNRIHKIQF